MLADVKSKLLIIPTARMGGDIDWKEGKKAQVRKKVPTRGEADYFMKDSTYALGEQNRRKTPIEGRC